MKQFGCEHILEFLLVASDYNLTVNKFLPFATWYEGKKAYPDALEQCLKTSPHSEGKEKSLKQGWPALPRTQGGNFSFHKNH